MKLLDRELHKKRPVLTFHRSDALPIKMARTILELCLPLGPHEESSPEEESTTWREAVPSFASPPLGGFRADATVGFNSGLILWQVLFFSCLSS
jgi:hypothetical protein